MTGPSRGFGWIRNGPLSLNRENILSAIEGSLRRLQTDYVDLYQIHWPARNVPMFGSSSFAAEKEHTATSIEEQLTVLSELVSSGKVRHIGMSNETPWGVAEFLKVAERLGLQRIVSIQNAYNLLNRTFELSLQEVCYREQISLLVYSPLAFGLLSGKYVNKPPAAGRLSLYPQFGQRYHKPNVSMAVQAYAELAKQNGLSAAQMAISYVRSRAFVGSTIIGATQMAQLQENLELLELDATIIKGIDEIHLRYFNPAP